MVEEQRDSPTKIFYDDDETESFSDRCKTCGHTRANHLTHKNVFRTLAVSACNKSNDDGINPPVPCPCVVFT